MLSYPSGLSVSSRALNLLADALRTRRRKLRSRWRRLDPGRQALLVLAYLRKGETYTDLAVGFGVGVSTAYRYIREGLTLLAGMAPTLEQAMQVAAGKAYVIIDGSLLRIDRVAMAKATGKYRPLSAGQKAVNTAHARMRGPGERANAEHKSWKILDAPARRCSTWSRTSATSPSTTLGSSG